MISYGFNYSRCHSGHYCPPATVNPNDNPCPAGRYTNATNLIDDSQCDICPERVACLAGTGGAEGFQFVPCSPGHWCGYGTQFASQHDCAPGRYTAATNLRHQDECSPCPEGKYCVGGQPAISGDCAQGHYCPLNTSSATSFDCPAGRYTARVNLSNANECSICPKGHYCQAGSVLPQP